MIQPPSDEPPKGEGAPGQLASELGPGSVLGKYRITKKLGEGGMGVVFAGVHERLGRSVAIKILRRDLCESPEQLLRFQREAELVTRIGHPNIVAVYDFGRIGDGSLYYVMEVLSGESMRGRLTRGPMSDPEISAVFSQLLSAVNAAHAVGAVHRDLKPDNVMLVPAGEGEPPQVKLLDFGVAKIHGDATKQNELPTEVKADGTTGGMTGAPTVEPNSLATAAGAIMGTPAYMAPEQITGASKVDQRADIYAIGVMLFEALTGKRPFNGSFGDLMGQHLFKEPPAPSVTHVEEKLPARNVNWDRLDAMVLRTLAKEPENRYPDCSSLLADLEGVLGARRPSPSSLPDLTRMEAAQSAANQAEQRRTQRRFLMIGAGLLAVLLGGGLLWRILSMGPRARHIDLGRTRQQAATLIAAQRAQPSSIPELLGVVALTRSRAFLPVVEEALGSDRSEVWRMAVEAALRICQPKDEELRTALAAVADEAVGSGAVDVAVARQLCGDPAAKNMLISLASAPALDVNSRLRAVLALAGAGQISASALRAAFSAALRAGAVPLELRRSVLTQLLNMNDAESLHQANEAAQLPASAQGDEKQRRLEALQVLALSHQPKAGDFLYSAATHAGGDDHVAMALALAEAGDAWAPRLVQPLLHDPAPKLRARAAAALGWLAQQGKWPSEPDGLIAILEPLLSDRDPEVALTAAVLLADADTVSTTAPHPAGAAKNPEAPETEAP